jgi:hypothetical protein
VIEYAKLAAIISVAIFIWACYRYGFQLKSFWRSNRLCRRNGHEWFTVYSFTQQCKVCYKVADLSREVTKL